MPQSEYSSCVLFYIFIDWDGGNSRHQRPQQISSIVWQRHPDVQSLQPEHTQPHAEPVMRTRLDTVMAQRGLTWAIRLTHTVIRRIGQWLLAHNIVSIQLQELFIPTNDRQKNEESPVAILWDLVGFLVPNNVCSPLETKSFQKGRMSICSKLC